MGHLLLVVLHVVAILFAPVFLIVTVPAHLIYGVIDGLHAAIRRTGAAARCPDCREPVLQDARKCKHCGCALAPKSSGAPVQW